jgi:hypothetical protein
MNRRWGVTKPKDDLEAVRLIAETLEAFSNDERERILRWVREKLGMITVADAGHRTPPPPAGAGVGAPTGAQTGSGKKDLKTFVADKNPRGDNQMSAVVAYYYRFVAPEDQRKESILRMITMPAA